MMLISIHAPVKGATSNEGVLRVGLDISTLASWRLNPSMHVMPISSTEHILYRPDAIIHRSLLTTAGL